MEKTFQSVLNQNFKGFEYIVIDGGSTDGSVDVIKQYSDVIDYWVSEPDNGIYHAMNKGTNVSHGDYLIFMNSGDVFHSNDVLGQCIPELTGEDIITGDLLQSDGESIISPQKIDFMLFYKKTLSHQASFIKSSVMKQYGYDENLKIVSDWKFFIQALIIGNASYKKLDFVVADYDVFGISYTSWDLTMQERNEVLYSLFPSKVLENFEILLSGETWEDKLYIDIKKNRFHNMIYSYNVLILRFLTLFCKGSNWINKYPIKL